MHFSPTGQPPSSFLAPEPLILVQTFLSSLNIANHSQSWATICGGAPPELNVRRLQIDDRFVQTADLRVATERRFLAENRGMCADKRVGGSRGKLYRCDGAVFDVKSKAKETRGCRALVRACWQSSTQEWKATEVSYEHTLCCGGTKNASPRALWAEAVIFINSNTNMTVSSLKSPSLGAVS